MVQIHGSGSRKLRIQNTGFKIPRPARLSSVSLADFFARKDLADFLLEALLDFLAIDLAHSVFNILSYLNIKNLPILFATKFGRRHRYSLNDEPEIKITMMKV